MCVHQLPGNVHSSAERCHSGGGAPLMSVHLGEKLRMSEEQLCFPWSSPALKTLIGHSNHIHLIAPAYHCSG